MAEIKAAGIVEGSRAWQNALHQIGVTARDYPIIKRQMEAADYAKSQRPMRERAQQVQTELGEQNLEMGGMNIDAAQKQNRDDKLFADIAIESKGDPGKFKTRAKELQRPDMWAQFEKLDAERKTLLAQKTEAEAKQWTARAAAMTSALHPLATLPETATEEEMRAAWQTSIAAAQQIDPEFGKDFAAEPNPFDWNRVRTAYGMGLTAAERQGPTPSAAMKDLADFTKDFIEMEGLTPGPQARIQARRALAELKKGGVPSPSYTDWMIWKAETERRGRQPNPEEFLAAQAEHTTSKRRPEDEQIRDLRIQSMQLQNELAAERLTRSGQLTAGQFMSISKAAMEEAIEAQFLEGEERKPEEIYPELLQRKLAEITSATGIRSGPKGQSEAAGGPAASQAADRQILEQAGIGETVTLSDGRKFKKLSATEVEAVP
ncbi:MAG TPA: hypothetical protein ENH84_04390 [Phycisphaerae bacterium]|nr:hypothetical protein [Phycisphaerae bacterium]